MEALERAYRATPARYSTEEVGLARLGRDLEIIRIGDPVPGEFAAWRWGSRFGKRLHRLKSSLNTGKLFQVESGTAWAAGVALAPLLPVLAPLAVAVGALAAPLLLLTRLEAEWAVEAGGHRVGRLEVRAGGITRSDLFPGWSIQIRRPQLVEGTSNSYVLRWKEFSGEEAVRLGRHAFLHSPHASGAALGRARIESISRGVLSFRSIGS